MTRRRLSGPTVRLLRRLGSLSRNAVRCLRARSRSLTFALVITLAFSAHYANLLVEC